MFNSEYIKQLKINQNINNDRYYYFTGKQKSNNLGIKPFDE